MQINRQNIPVEPARFTRQGSPRGMASAKSPQAALSIDVIEDNPTRGSRRTDGQRSLCVDSTPSNICGDVDGGIHGQGDNAHNRL